MFAIYPSPALDIHGGILSSSTFPPSFVSSNFRRLPLSPPKWVRRERMARPNNRVVGEVPTVRVCKAKDTDSEGFMTGLDQKTLERELQIAIDEENYVKAAKIRDNLRSLQEDSKALVLAANDKFYESFRNGDIAAMQTLWSKGENVCCVHPGNLGISGHESVVDSWNHVWANYEFPLEIELREVKVHVRGDVGYVTCVELVKTKGSNWGGQFVTNVFEKIGDQWFICIHHASPFDF